MIETRPYPAPTEKNITSMPALLYFVWEREAIRLARDNDDYTGELTRDPILSKYKFTNIRRKDDRVSKWIIDNVIQKGYRKDLWFVLLICRLVNWPPTLQHLIDENVLFQVAGDFDPIRFSEVIESFKEEGKKVYSGAYMVYPTKKEAGSVKSLSLGKYIIEPVLERADEIDYAQQDSIAKFVEELAKCFGISTFIAGQVAADLTYCQATLSEAVDLYTYAPIGPGSSKGLNYLLGRSPYASWKQVDFNAELITIRNQIVDELEIKDMTLHDVQNCMCEYSKYARTVLGEGQPKSMYRPQEGF